MEQNGLVPKTVDEYIAQFPNGIAEKLRAMRALIREAAPDAKEGISYRMPAYDQNGILVYFAAFKRHIGFYPTAEGMEAFRDRLSQYKTSKGAVQFPLNEPLPIELIREMVRHRVEQNSAGNEINTDS